MQHESSAAEEQKENITFRFNKLILDRLRFEAEQRNVSANSIAQEIVNDYYNWTAKAAKAGMIPIHKSMLATFMDNLSDEEIIKMAELFAEAKLKDILLVLRSEYSLPAFLDMFEAWLRSSSVMFGKDLRSNIYSYVIHHDLGNRWSLFLSTMVKSVLEKMDAKNMSLQVTESTVMFDIPLETLEPKAHVNKK